MIFRFLLIHTPTKEYPHVERFIASLVIVLISLGQLDVIEAVPISEGLHVDNLLSLFKNGGFGGNIVPLSISESQNYDFEQSGKKEDRHGEEFQSIEDESIKVTTFNWVGGTEGGEEEDRVENPVKALKVKTRGRFRQGIGTFRNYYNNFYDEEQSPLGEIISSFFPIFSRRTIEYWLSTLDFILLLYFNWRILTTRNAENSSARANGPESFERRRIHRLSRSLTSIQKKFWWPFNRRKELVFTKSLGTRHRDESCEYYGHCHYGHGHGHDHGHYSPNYYPNPGLSSPGINYVHHIHHNQQQQLLLGGGYPFGGFGGGIGRSNAPAPSANAYATANNPTSVSDNIGGGGGGRNPPRSFNDELDHDKREVKLIREKIRLKEEIHKLRKAQRGGVREVHHHHGPTYLKSNPHGHGWHGHRHKDGDSSSSEEDEDEIDRKLKLLEAQKKLAALYLFGSLLGAGGGGGFGGRPGGFGGLLGGGGDGIGGLLQSVIQRFPNMFQGSFPGFGNSFVSIGPSGGNFRPPSGGNAGMNMPQMMNMMGMMGMAGMSPNIGNNQGGNQGGNMNQNRPAGGNQTAPASGGQTAPASNLNTTPTPPANNMAPMMMVMNPGGVALSPTDVSIMPPAPPGGGSPGAISITPTGGSLIPPAAPAATPTPAPAAPVPTTVNPAVLLAAQYLLEDVLNQQLDITQTLNAESDTDAGLNDDNEQVDYAALQDTILSTFDSESPREHKRKKHSKRRSKFKKRSKTTTTIAPKTPVDEREDDEDDDVSSFFDESIEEIGR